LLAPKEAAALAPKHVASATAFKEFLAMKQVLGLLQRFFECQKRHVGKSQALTKQEARSLSPTQV